MKPEKNSAGGGLRLILKAALIVWLSLSLLPSIARAQQSAANKGMLVLDWYHKDHPWNVKFDPSFQSSLHSVSEETFESYFEYLESYRFPGEKQSILLSDYLRQKYADHRIDVIVANSDASLDFLRKYRGILFPHTPIVF